MRIDLCPPPCNHHFFMYFLEFYTSFKISKYYVIYKHKVQKLSIRMKSSSLPSLLKNYHGKSSRLSLRRDLSSDTLKKLSYLRMQKSEKKAEPQTTETIDKNNDTEEEPIDDIGGPKFFTSVDIVKRRNHTQIFVPSFTAIGTTLENTPEDALIQRFDFCKNICDFSDPESDTAAKKAKTAVLKDLISLMNKKESLEKLNQNLISLLFSNVFAANIFRQLPSIPEKNLVYDDEPLYQEVNWPHLQLVYTLLLQFQNLWPNNPNFNVEFETGMLEASHSCDPNEREMIYQFFVVYSNTFSSRIPFIFSKYAKYCAAYTSGFCYPFVVTPALKYILLIMKLTPKIPEKNIFYFTQSVLPLIKAPHFFTLEPLIFPLFDTVLGKVPDYAESFLKYIMMHWPESKPSKQLFYIELIVVVLEKLSLNDFSKVCKSVFAFLSNCYNSKYHKVAELSFKIWSNVKLIPLILDNTRVIFPVIINPLLKSMKEHWNQKTRSAALNAYKQIHDIDPFVFDEISVKLAKKSKTKEEANNDVQKNWSAIARSAARQRKSDIDLARVLADIQTTFVNK